MAQDSIKKTDSLGLFCAINGFDLATVDKDVFYSLYDMRTVEDVIRSPLIRNENKLNFLRSFRAAKQTNCKRNYLTQGITKALIKTNTSTHPFDACPNLGICFELSPDGSVEMDMQLHNIMNSIKTPSSTVMW